MVRKRVGSVSTTDEGRVGTTVTSQRRRFSSIRPSVRESPVASAQQQTIQKTLSTINQREESLKARRADLVNKLRNAREFNLGQGDITRANQNIAIINSQLQAIDQTRSSIESGRVVTSSAATEFIEASASARAELRVQSERVRKAAEKKEIAERTTKKREEVKIPQPDTPTITAEPNRFGGFDIQPVPEPVGFLEKARSFISGKRAEVGTKEARMQLDPLKAAALGFPLGVASSVLGTFEFGKQLITNPIETTTQVAGGIKTEFSSLIKGKLGPGLESAAETVFREPGFATGVIVGEVAQGVVGSKVISKTQKLAETTKARIFSKGEFGDDFIKVTTTADDVKVLREAGSVKSLSEPIKEQIKLAGTKVDAVSASKGIFGKVLDRKITIDKPLLSPDDLPIERSLFADPKGRFRPSRLGLTQETADLSDIIFGDVTFKRTKPQILFFPDTEVSSLPVDIVKTLSSGDDLSSPQLARLQKFQLEPSGQFKPLGFISKEPEITLAPGEIIFRKKVIGRGVLQGRGVEVIETGIKQASLELKGLISRADLTDLEKLRLKRLLGQETGLSITGEELPFSSPTTTGLSISSIGLSPSKVSIPMSSASSITPSGRSIVPSSPSTISSPTISSPISSPSISTPSSPLKTSGRIISPGASPSIIRPGVRPPPVTPPPTFFKFDSKKQPKKQEGLFFTQVRRGGIFKTIGKAPTAARAFSIGKERVGKTLAATFRIRGRGKLVKLPTLPTSIRRKKGKRLTFIEKKQFRLDTPGEIEEIQFARIKGKLKL